MKFLFCENGDRLPVLGLGTWKAEAGEVYRAVRHAISIGYRHFDCAAIYGNEGEIGRGLTDALVAGDVQRSDLWITSKLWNDSHRKAAAGPALEKTLTDLQLEYLDLYLIHWPIAFKEGVSFPHSREDFYTLAEVPLAETWSALEDCVDRGLTRHIGTSNFSVTKLQNLLDNCRIRPAVNQVEMHPLLSQPKLKKFCDANSVLMTAYSPLGSGDRSTMMKAADEPLLMELDVIVDVAAGRGISPAQVLLAWAVNRGTSVIPKSVDPGRMEQNLAAVDIELSSDEMARINSLDRHYRYVKGGFFAGRNSPYTIGGIWDE